MKTISLGFILLSCALSASAVEKAELDNRIRALTAKFEAMQHQDKSIPADYLRKARGIVLLDRTRAGFLFAYQGGGGVALARDPGNRSYYGECVTMRDILFDKRVKPTGTTTDLATKIGEYSKDSIP